MTDRELMRQALEALEANPAELHDEFGGPDNGSRAVEILQHKAITALRDRLEQSEQEPLTNELLKLLEQIYWIMKDDMPVALRSECFEVLDRCGVNV